MSVCLYICVCIWVCVCVPACACAHVCMCMHTQAHHLRNFSGNTGAMSSALVRYIMKPLQPFFNTVGIIITTGILCSQTFKLSDTRLPEAKLHIWMCLTTPPSNLLHHLSLAFPSDSGNVFIVCVWHIAFHCKFIVYILKEHS